MMDDYQKYYVYKYLEDDGTIVYIGKGNKGRAWHCGYMRGDTEERHNWKEEQLEKGRLPCDWVEVVERGLSHKEAIALEKKLIMDYKPALNRNNNPEYKHSKVNLDGIEFSKQLRAMGYSYENVAYLSGCSAMTMHRALNNGYKGVN